MTPELGNHYAPIPTLHNELHSGGACMQKAPGSAAAALGDTQQSDRRQPEQKQASNQL
jgi:hypothetical protein